MNRSIGTSFVCMLKIVFCLYFILTFGHFEIIESNTDNFTCIIFIQFQLYAG